jgi:hypothetical protein
MLLTKNYNRDRAVEYARRWALDRNPLFVDFTGIGGNCTNFVSQCVLAGCCTMNYTPDFGWYYVSPEERAPAWSSVEYFYDFLTEQPDFKNANGGIGPFAREVAREEAAETLNMVRRSMKINYFEDAELIRQQSEMYKAGK